MTILLQACSCCGTRQYPSRDVCRNCLSDRLTVEENPGLGRLLATTEIHRSLEAGFAPQLPSKIGTVVLDCGPHLICFVDGIAAPGERVALSPAENVREQKVWIARAWSSL